MAERGGEKISLRLTRPMTMDWMVRHTTGLMSGAKGEALEDVKNIHTDVEFARRNALDRPVPDGMVIGNWISSLMIDRFGIGYVASGSLDVKFIRSTHEGEEIEVLIDEESRAQEAAGTRVTLRVEARRGPDEPVTVGRASALIDQEV
jgi:acyl dehydratase